MNITKKTVKYLRNTGRRWCHRRPHVLVRRPPWYTTDWEPSRSSQRSRITCDDGTGTTAVYGRVYRAYRRRPFTFESETVRRRTTTTRYTQTTDQEPSMCATAGSFERRRPRLSVDRRRRRRRLPNTVPTPPSTALPPQLPIYHGSVATVTTTTNTTSTLSWKLRRRRRRRRCPCAPVFRTFIFFHDFFFLFLVPHILD